MKLIKAQFHGILDFVTVAIFALAPTVLVFGGWPAYIAYILAGVHFLLTITTAFPFGVVKLIPFPLHGWIERIVGPALIILPIVVRFETKAMIFYIVMGGIIVLVGLFSDYSPVKKA